MSLNNFVKRLQDVMRNDAGINGDAQRIEQMVWILFLKVYNAKEEEWELLNDHYTSVIPEKFRWSNWASDHKDGKALTGEALLNFINNELFPALKNLEIDETTPMSKIIVKSAFEDNNNYMKDGILLRQVVNIIDELDFGEYDDRHAFGDIYETILRSLQSAGNAGEFYTPRAVTDFMTQMIAPKIDEKIADFACGTGGFITSALKVLDAQVKSAADKETYNNAVYGVEKKALPHLLCVTNMLLHDIDNPVIIHGNSLEHNVRDYKENDRFDVVLMNPPYGGSEKESVKINFPSDLQSSETADLFMSVIMYRLKKNGRAAVIIPDGFLFGTDNAKVAIKKKMLEEFNLHTIVRMPHSVFAPYTSITTNILFFERSKPTKETWFYRLDMPDGYKNFSKTKPMKLEHFAPAIEWWNNRDEIAIDGFDKAKRYMVQELIDRNFNIDLCGFPHEEEEILPPHELIQQYQEKRTSLNADIDRILAEIEDILGVEVQDENDEPASELLERIRADKEQLIKDGKIKKEKPLPPITEDEIPFDVPESWEWVRLGTLINKITDGAHNTPKYTESGVPFLSVKDISSGMINFDNTKFISPEEHAELYKRCNPERGDILLTKVGTTGIPVLIETDKEFSLFVSVALLKFNQKLLYGKYLVKLLESPLVGLQCTENTRGVGNKNWVIRDIANTLVVLPPLAEQHRIVAKSEELMAMVDGLGGKI